MRPHGRWPIELVSAVVQMYGAGLERIVELLAGAGEDGRRVAASLSEDELVATLLLIHDLHPVPLEDRVQAALDSVRPYMESHGGNVELLSLDGRRGHHPSARQLLGLLGVGGDARAGDQAGAGGGRARSRGPGGARRRRADRRWARTADGQRQCAVRAHRDGAPGGDVRGGWGPGSPSPRGWRCRPSTGWPTARWRPSAWPGPTWWSPTSTGRCWPTAIAAPTAGGRCTPGCCLPERWPVPSVARSFFLPRAGRSLDDEQMQLEPVPLLRDEGRVKVALAQ